MQDVLHHLPQIIQTVHVSDLDNTFCMNARKKNR